MRRLLTFISALCIFLAALSHAETSAEPAKGGPAVRAKDFVLSYFRPVDGSVAETDGAAVKLKFPEGAEISKGMRLSVFRQGKPFYNPVTNEFLGNAEDFIGKVAVSGDKDADGLYPATILNGDVKSGDFVRVPRSKIKLAFFQERKADWELSEAFYGALKESERFDLLESYTASYEPKDLSQLARGLNAEAFLVFSTPVRDGRSYLSVHLYWADDASWFAGTDEQVGDGGVNIFAPEEKFITESLTDKEPWGSYRIAGGRLFAVGDVDGNGIQELVVSDGKSLRIYNFSEDLQEIWYIKRGPDETHVSIDILDMNNNGRAEIFVTSLSGDTGMRSDESRMMKMKAGGFSGNSYVIEYDPVKGYTKIKDNMPYFFRADGRSLLMQEFGRGSIFSGPVYEGVWKDGEYRTGASLTLPSGVNIYGFTFVDWQNRGQRNIMTFDDKGYLILYDAQGNDIWRSRNAYGNFAQSYDREMQKQSDMTGKWIVRGRLMTVSTARGEEVIVVNRMPLVAQAPGLGTKGAEVYSLWWDGGEMQEKTILANIPGSVSDYWVDGRKLYLLSRGDLISFVKNAVTGELSKGSMLYYYNFGDK